MAELTAAAEDAAGWSVRSQAVHSDPHLHLDTHSHSGAEW